MKKKPKSVAAKCVAELRKIRPIFSERAQKKILRALHKGGLWNMTDTERNELVEKLAIKRPLQTAVTFEVGTYMLALHTVVSYIESIGYEIVRKVHLGSIADPKGQKDMPYRVAFRKFKIVNIDNVPHKQYEDGEVQPIDPVLDAMCWEAYKIIHSSGAVDPNGQLEKAAEPKDGWTHS